MVSPGLKRAHLGHRRTWKSSANPATAVAGDQGRRSRDVRVKALASPSRHGSAERNQAWRPQRRQGQESATLPVPEESQDSLGDAPAASRCEGRRVAPLVRRLNGAIQWACCVRHPLRAYEGQQGSIASCWLRRTGYCERQDRIPRNESVCPIGRLARSPNRGRAGRLAERLNATRAGLVRV